ERRDENWAGAAVLEAVRADLGHHERDVAGALRVEAESFRKLRRRATGRGDLAPVLDDQRPRRGDHFHRVIITRGPSPGRDSMLNSLDSRLSPLNPTPRPSPVVQPSSTAR